jgi:hypothetical protein
MFALVVSSRPVITQFQTVTPSQFAFSLQPGFTYLTVFLLPGQVLPPDTAATVYIRLTPASEFKLLGAIANEKQSAIFKVKESATQGINTAVSNDDLMVDDDLSTSQASGAEIVVGISIEPVEAVQAQLATLKPQSSVSSNSLQLYSPPAQTRSVAAGTIPTKILAQRIIKNAFNFLSSFGDTVPLKSFENWWHKFEKRIELDPGFLERED